MGAFATQTREGAGHIIVAGVIAWSLFTTGLPGAGTPMPAWLPSGILRGGTK